MSGSVLEHWWPVTYDYGLVKSDVQTVTEMRRAQYKTAGLECATREMKAPLQQCLAELEPLSPAPTKELFLQTTFGWTVFFQNGCRGSDPALPMLQLSKALGTSAVRVCATHESAAYPAVILSVYDTAKAGGDKRGYRRSIAAMNDGGRWIFEHSGRPFPFEDTSRFNARMKRDRFTPSMLAEYLQNLGIQQLTDDSLQPGGACNGALIARSPHDHLPKYSLDAAKSL